MYKSFFKRFFDIFLSFLGIVLLSWLFIVISLAIVIDDPGPVFFKQRRVGKGKKLFNILKFRSMKVSAPKNTPTHLLDNPDEYITRVGKFLRKTSLDELPQMFNILIGQMSIVGPRPALWNQYDLIAERDKYGANDVRPGLTGWAQINGRDKLEIPIKAELDGYYVANMGFAMDFKCFWRTVIKVITHDGVVEGGTGMISKVEANEKEVVEK